MTETERKTLETLLGTHCPCKPCIAWKAAVRPLMNEVITSAAARNLALKTQGALAEENSSLRVGMEAANLEIMNLHAENEALRTQLALGKEGSFCGLPGVILANLIGGLMFFWIDRWIFGERD